MSIALQLPISILKKNHIKLKTLAAQWKWERERKNVTAWEFNLLKPVDGVVIFPLISFVGNLFAYGYGCVCGFVEDFAFKKGIRGEKTRE